MIGGKAGCDKVEGTKTVNAAILSFPKLSFRAALSFTDVSFRLAAAKWRANN